RPARRRSTHSPPALTQRIVAEYGGIRCSASSATEPCADRIRKTAKELITWLEDAVATGWNVTPTPFIWDGKRRERRPRATTSSRWLSRDHSPAPVKCGMTD